jgi:hypothetical protein
MSQTVPTHHSVTPWIVTDDSAAMIEYLRDAFGGEELGRVHDEHGRVGHAEVRIGDSIVLLFDRLEGWSSTPALLRLYVEDGDVPARSGRGRNNRHRDDRAGLGRPHRPHPRPSWKRLVDPGSRPGTLPR